MAPLYVFNVNWIIFLHFCTLHEEKSGKPGVDVMITIFCDFCLFSAKKLAFFSKTNVTIKFLQKVAAV
jgi:hypothetical protein